MAIFRDYEVSVWTLQDEFLTVLKPRQADTRKFLDEPQIKLNVDGTEEFTFSVPMYIYEGTERIENPIWYNTHKGPFQIRQNQDHCDRQADPAGDRRHGHIVTSGVC